MSNRFSSWMLSVVGCWIKEGGKSLPHFLQPPTTTQAWRGNFRWDGVELIGTLSSALIWIHRCSLVGKVEAEAGVDAVAGYRVAVANSWALLVVIYAGRDDCIQLQFKPLWFCRALIFVISTHWLSGCARTQCDTVFSGWLKCCFNWQVSKNCL